MARYDPSRSFNAMLGLPSKPYDPKTPALGLIARWERAMSRPARELSDLELGTLFAQNPSEAERPLLVAAAIDKIATRPLSFVGQRFIDIVLGHRAILDAHPELRLRLATALRVHRRAFMGEEEERDVCELLEAVESSVARPRATYEPAHSMCKMLGYASWEQEPGNPYDRGMTVAASALDADALEAIYAHYPNAEERRLLASAAVVDLLERDALAAAGRPLLGHLLVDSREALATVPGLRPRLRAILATSASAYVDDPDAPLVRAFLTTNQRPVPPPPPGHGHAIFGPCHPPASRGVFRAILSMLKPARNG